MSRVEINGAFYDSRYVERMGAVERVSERTRQMAKCDGVDLLKRTEGRVLAKLVGTVHDVGRVGLHWPKVERVAFDIYSEQMPSEDVVEHPDEVHEWQVRASVRTIPAGTVVT